MRIVGGSLSGRRFTGPKGGRVRPTSERVREAMASALESRGAIRGAQVLDLFAGTGALAFECLSRGAERAVLVDKDARVLRDVERSASELGLAAQARTRSVNLLGEPSRVVAKLRGDGPFTLVFMDPPYAEVERLPPTVRALVDAGVIAPGALVVLERGAQSTPPAFGLASEAQYRYGDTAVDMGRVPNRGDDPPP
jgi:16S rRNA (guanine966-N2)-methyltransferase